jgi:hypothetical protein
MKNTQLLIFYFLLASSSLFAQSNLVRNGNFEQAISSNFILECPNVSADNQTFFSNLAHWEIHEPLGAAQAIWINSISSTCNQQYADGSLVNPPGFPITSLNSQVRFIRLQIRPQLGPLGFNLSIEPGAVLHNLQSPLQANTEYIFRLKYSSRSAFPMNDPNFDQGSLLKIFFSQFSQNWDHSSNPELFEASNLHVFSENIQNQIHWRQIQKNFTIPDNMNNLGILVLQVTQGTFFIDDIEIYKRCDYEYLVQDYTYFSSLNDYNQGGFDYSLSALNNIKVGENVDPNKPGGPVLISGNTTLTAGEYIEFHPGVIIESIGINDIVSAQIMPCNANGQRNIPADTIANVPNSNANNLNFDSTIENNSQSRKESLVIYPNPTISSLQINSTNSIQRIAILNLLGEKVLEYNQLNHTMFECNLQSLSNGIYMLLVEMEEAREIRKVIVARE